MLDGPAQSPSGMGVEAKEIASYIDKWDGKAHGLLKRAIPARVI